MLPVELKRVYDILRLVLGESKQGDFNVNESQYQFNSPWITDENGGIPDGKYNLEVSLSLGKYHDWSTENGGNLSKLVRKWGSKELLSEYFRIINEIKDARYYNLELFKDNGEDLGFYNSLKLPLTFKKINIESCKKQKLLDYLQQRKITQEIIDFYNIGYTTWDEEKWQMRDRIIVPSYNSEGDLNFWVGRDFINKKDSSKTKYKNCKADKKKIIFCESNIQWNNDIWLCEGIFDSLVHPNAIPLMGKALKSDTELYKALMEKANANVTICLDADTTPKETKVIYNLLNKGRLKDKIYYIDLKNDSEFKDFAEVYENKGKQGIIDIFKKRKKYSEIELLI